MKFIGKEITKNKYRQNNDMIEDTFIKTYFFFILVSKKVVTTTTPIPPIKSIKRKINDQEIVLEIGMRVLNRSNEPDDLMICKIIGFEDFGGKVHGGGGAFPIIVDEKDSKEYVTMGIVIPYSDELYNKLIKMKSIEQYNYLSPAHCQISSKYGIKYKTFK